MVTCMTNMASITVENKDGELKLCVEASETYINKLEKLNMNHTSISENKITYQGGNCVDIIDKIDHNSTEIENVIGKLYKFKYVLCHPKAIAPTKANSSDSGFDLSILDLKKKTNNVYFYHTGVKVMPDHGMYFDLVPRSSISKTGYMLANNIGIIDQGYNGEIIVALIKIDETAEDLTLPCKIAQLIPRQWMNVRGVHVEELQSSLRGDGGFGSTGK